MPPNIIPKILLEMKAGTAKIIHVTPARKSIQEDFFRWSLRILPTPRNKKPSMKKVRALIAEKIAIRAIKVTTAAISSGTCNAAATLLTTASGTSRNNIFEQKLPVRMAPSTRTHMKTKRFSEVAAKKA